MLKVKKRNSPEHYPVALILEINNIHMTFKQLWGLDFTKRKMFVTLYIISNLRVWPSMRSRCLIKAWLKDGLRPNSILFCDKHIYEKINVSLVPGLGSKFL